MLFDNIPQAPQDAILGLTEAFRKDPNPDKINLSVGVYQDETGKTPVLKCVDQAEHRLLEEEASRSYLPITGLAEYAGHVQNLLFGGSHEAVTSGRCVTVQTPGGTGALRVAADFVKANLPGTSVWVSAPTWPNHHGIFHAAGLEVKTYPYFNPATNDLRFEEMIAAVREIPSGDVILLHGCCHNPTGIDPTAQQWQTLAEVIAERGLLPLLDFAYQGLGDGFAEDSAGLHELVRASRELIVCNSFSKNFGLYCERVGAMTLVCNSRDAVTKVASQIKICVRTNYSNPPAHGARIVSTVLADTALRSLWEDEVAQMRQRIQHMRQLFVETLASKGAAGDYGFITQQRGMFSFSGLLPEQVKKLREEHSIYIVGSGRINVAGMNESNMSRLCEAIASVL